MAIKFQTDVPVALAFPYGDFREFQGQHGPQFLYTVQLNGDPREKLYATPALHRELQAAGVGAGTLLTITKLGGADGQYWRVQDAQSSSAASNGHAHEPAKPSPTSQGASHTATPLSPPANSTRQGYGGTIGFTGLEHLLGHCLAASARVCRTLNNEVQFTSEDVRRLGVTLFLECSRKGVLPEPLQQ